MHVCMYVYTQHVQKSPIYRKDKYSYLSLHKVFHLSLSLLVLLPPLSPYLEVQILLSCVRAFVRFRLAASSVCWDSELVVLELVEDEEGEEEEEGR